LLRFDGCSKNDEVHLQLSFIFFKQQWISIITEFENNVNEIFFVDEGISLPFFLKSWKHKHIIRKHNGSTQIIDDIEFNTGNKITDMIFYPLLFMQFLYENRFIEKCLNKKAPKYLPRGFLFLISDYLLEHHHIFSNGLLFSFNT
jgi:ligand-binding SRPBCC domain-containing protein